jgi:hypothetical protein
MPRPQKVHLCVLICALLFGQKLFGQAATPQSSSEGWQVQTTPYLWAPGIDGRIGIRDRTAAVDASIGNVLDHLHLGFMNLADATWNDRIVILTDVVYADLRGHHATPGPLFSGVHANQKMFFLNPEAGYRVLHDTRKGFLDVVGGIRYWHLKTDLEFQPGRLSGIDVEGSRGWVDGVLGLRGKMYLPGKWWFSGYADLGGGGSNFTYQVIESVGRDIHKNYAFVLGYRYLNVNYNKDGFLFDNAIQGPIFGFTFKF